METLFGLIGSVLTGGATGLLGVIIQRFADYKNKQLDMQIRVQDRAHELAVMDREWAGRVKVAEVEGASREAVADSGALAESYKGAFDRFATWDMRREKWWVKAWMVFLDVIRGLVRPGLTIYLCAITTMIYVEAQQVLVSTAPDPEAASVMVKHIVNVILYLTTTCVLWWFGTRNKQKAPD